jgi:hypothetical protein
MYAHKLPYNVNVQESTLNEGLQHRYCILRLQKDKQLKQLLCVLFCYDFSPVMTCSRELIVSIYKTTPFHSSRRPQSIVLHTTNIRYTRQLK